MDNFREWLSDNLRYILLGLAVIVVIAVVVVGVRLVGSLIGGGSDDSQLETLPPMTETGSESESQTETISNPLQQDIPAVLEAVQQYYQAISSKDIETVRNMSESFTEEDQQRIENNLVESYDNIATYSKTGPVDGSYVVYVYYEAKIPGIETATPSLISLYLETAEDGTLYKADTNDEEVESYIQQCNEDSDVQSLMEEVNAKLEEVLEADPELASLLEEQGQPDTEIALPDSSQVDVQVNTAMVTTDEIILRADSRTDSDQLNVIPAGTTVTRVEELDNGWSRIRYDDGSGQVYEGYVMTQYLTSASSETQETAAAETGTQETGTGET